jgi:hypothetical protein
MPAELSCVISRGNFKQVYSKKQSIFRAFYVDVSAYNVVLCCCLTSLNGIIYCLVSSVCFYVKGICLCTPYTKTSLCVTNLPFGPDVFFTSTQFELCCFVTLTEHLILRELAFLKRFSLRFQCSGDIRSGNLQIYAILLEEHFASVVRVVREELSITDWAAGCLISKAFTPADSISFPNAAVCACTTPKMEAPSC